MAGHEKDIFDEIQCSRKRRLRPFPFSWQGVALTGGEWPREASAYGGRA